MRSPQHNERIGISIFLILITTILCYTDALWTFDRFFYDQQLRLFSRAVSKEIVIIQVDEKSLKAIGRWPWSRSLHAQLLDKLSTIQTQGIGLDFIFAEPDRNNPAADLLLANAIKHNRQIVLPVIFEYSEQTVIETPPLPIFAQHAHLGHAHANPDKDGVHRSVYLKAGLGAAHWSSLALTLYNLQKKTPLKPHGQRTQHAVHQHQLIEDYQIWLPFYDNQHTFTHISYLDVLTNEIPITFFKNKYVLIGLTASGLDYTELTPISRDNQQINGIDFIAAILDSLIKQVFWQPLPFFAQLIITLMMVILSICIYLRHSLRQILCLNIGLFLFTLCFSVILLHLTHYWFAPSVALFIAIISYPLWSWRYIDNIIQTLFSERKRALITLNAVTDCVITTSPEGIIEYVNPATQKILALKESELIGELIDKNILLTIPNQHIENLLSIIKQSLLEKKTFEYAQCELNSLLTQSPLIVNFTISPLINKNNIVCGAVLTFHDVSKLISITNELIKKAREQAELELKKDQAEQANKAKSQFLSHMSHELRTPLNAILGYSQLMQYDDESPLCEEHLGYIEEIILAGNHLLELINELLDLGKIESGHVNLNVTDVRFQELLNECVGFIKPMAANYAIHFLPKADNLGTFVLHVDRQRAKQILLNFMSNAIKYNRPDGSVTISGFVRDEKFLRVCITDTGKGLSELQQAKLFQPFQRLEAEKTTIEGTGIGLVITKQLAELMGGNVGVESQLEVGSTFWVEFLLASSLH